MKKVNDINSLKKPINLDNDLKTSFHKEMKDEVVKTLVDNMKLPQK